MKIEPSDSIANRLRLAMDIRNMRQVELCEKTKLPKASINQYLSGYAEPKNDRLYMMADALKVNPVWLLGMDVPMELPKADLTKDNAETLALFMKDERFLEYMKKAHSLKHEKREVLYNYIDFLFSTNR